MRDPVIDASVAMKWVIQGPGPTAAGEMDADDGRAKSVFTKLTRDGSCGTVAARSVNIRQGVMPGQEQPENSHETASTLLFLCRPSRRRPRISAENEMLLADNPSE